jgi:hypothetical protein
MPPTHTFVAVLRGLSLPTTWGLLALSLVGQSSGKLSLVFDSVYRFDWRFHWFLRSWTRIGLHAIGWLTGGWIVLDCNEFTCAFP